ncbi:MAG: methylenetetrahydrofolate reductase C-terminal domain-containing protein [Desulfamplus sp.]|nr:methylenetetrahydrofolate reductase C-terminal domain-containing protein [Desulfamplus sp.]
MLRIFNNDISNPDKFVVTLELVPKRESGGLSTDALINIAKDAFADGRISAVSITDNPGGNPSLSPDVLGYEIFKHGMDVIVHFTCRDMNRAGMESRALQLARMGMKNILALTGDYSGKGFGGQGSPVFDFDSVILTKMLHKLNERLAASEDPDGFFTGCAVSPFKTTEAECEAQYRKLDRKIEAGASFIITQLGYDVDKFQELITQNRIKGITTPVLASVYMLSPKAAKAMNRGKVPGVIVSDSLCNRIIKEWENSKQEGLSQAIERAAKLAAILKGIGYNGIHIGGIHRSFKAVGKILDRMAIIEHNWQDYLEEFRSDDKNCFYLYKKYDYKSSDIKKSENNVNEYIYSEYIASQDNIPYTLKDNLFDHYPYLLLKQLHELFFNRASKLSPIYKAAAEVIDKNNKAWILKTFVEDPLKKLFLSCKSCGDCGIQHIAFQCPESGCPKHTRNGACGGSRDGFCEVNKDKKCIWVRAFNRLKKSDKIENLSKEFVHPRMWELNNTSSWINFHLGRDHQKE